MESNINDEITVDHEVNSELICEKLQKYGVCIVKNVLNETECSNLVNGMVETLCYVTSELPKPFNINDVSTWNTLTLLQPTRNLIFQHWGLGQAQCIWDVRCNPKVIDTFSKIYGTQDLLVSFDGFSFALPPELNNNKNWEKESWYHFDQNTKNKSFKSIQGWVNGFDTNVGDATLAVMIRSHLFHGQYGTEFPPSDNKDWVPVDDISFFKSLGCVEHRIIAPKGSIVLWDSRTLHYGAKPLYGREIPNYRAVAYLCYTPRSLITEKDRTRKKEIFHKRGPKGFKRVTNHLPHKPVMFSEIPYIRSGIIPNVLSLPDPIIPDQYKHLIGY